MYCNVASCVALPRDHDNPIFPALRPQVWVERVSAELMSIYFDMIYPPRGVRYFNGDQDGTGMDCAIPSSWEAAPSEILVNASQGTRPLNEESACASTQGIGLRYTIKLGSCAFDRPDLAIAEGCAATAGGRVWIVDRRR